MRLLRTLLGRGGVRELGVAPAELRYVRRRELLVGGNRITLLRSGGEAFPAMLAAIASARHHVLLETYILRSDRTGEQFKQALIERSRAGVKVRLMFDSVGSYGLVSDAYLNELADAGVEIVEYHPITPWRRKLLERLSSLRASADRRLGRPAVPHRPREPGHWRINRRDHQKILVVDDSVAFTGGINVGDEYAPAPEGGGWYDLHARVDGPAALGLAEAFHRAWIDGDGEWFAAPPPAPGSSEALRPMLAHTCDNFGMRHRSRMHSAYRHAIHHATQSISITNAYFVPDGLLRGALYDAVRRGANVRIVVPGTSDVKFVLYASRYLYRRLLRRGVRIFEYPDKMMHAKAGVIDGTWATIGSFNLDRRSMLHNLEAGLVILDREFACSLERQFEIDVAQCREVTLEDCRLHSWTQRFLQWFAHLFAYWL